MSSMRERSAKIPIFYRYIKIKEGFNGAQSVL